MVPPMARHDRDTFFLYLKERVLMIAKAPHPPRKFGPSSSLTLLAGLWAIGVGAGLWALAGYETKAGRAAEPAAILPAACSLPCNTGHATLIMALHPNCPCSRASIGELALIMAHCPDRICAYVYFVRPSGFKQDPATADLWKNAAAIPGVTVIQDDGGVACRSFHAQTSGQAFLYDAAGVLRFSGGITASRGHAGDNDGRCAIESFVNAGITGRKTTPVFGCSLL
jgi:hypothetical protein